MPERILCLSVKQPWAEVLVSGQKTIELRTWWPRLQLPQLVAIHAGKEPDRHAPAYLRSLVCNHDIATGRPRVGGCVGVARFVDRIDYRPQAYPGRPVSDAAWEDAKNRFGRDVERHLCPAECWEPLVVGFRFDSPVRFQEIIPCKGRLQFFELAPEIEAQVREAMARG